MVYWFAVMVSVLATGDVLITTHFPNSPEFNTEEKCRRFAKVKSDELQVEVGTKNGMIFWKCEKVSYETIAKSLK